MTEDEQSIRDKILHVLRIYPGISPSMMHIGLGNNVKAIEWRPALDNLIREGIIKQEVIVAQSPVNHNTYRYFKLNIVSNPK